jgi:hypothetical protein
MKDLPSTPYSHKMVSIRVLYIGVLHQDDISTFLLPRDIQPYGCVEAVPLGTHRRQYTPREEICFTVESTCFIPVCCVGVRMLRDSYAELFF